jgi:acetoin utilization protein AcuB
VLVTMKAERVRHLPVLQGERLVGFISDHDLIRALGAPDETEASLERIQRARSLHVAEVMSAKVVTVKPDDSAARAGELLVRRRIGAAPVLRGQRLVGMLTVCDFFQYLASMSPPGVEASPE